MESFFLFSSIDFLHIILVLKKVQFTQDKKCCWDMKSTISVAEVIKPFQSMRWREYSVNLNAQSQGVANDIDNNDAYQDSRGFVSSALEMLIVRVISVVTACAAPSNDFMRTVVMGNTCTMTQKFITVLF